MHEIELKFQVPPNSRAAVERAVAGQRVHLQAAYVDTADRALAGAGLALRVRREGRQWVQTLKGEAVDGMTRLEHNVRLQAPAGKPPAADPRLHAHTPVGELLAAALRKAADPVLVVHYCTDIWRLTRELRTSHGRVELAFDQGVIEAADRQLPVCELEIELISGTPAAVLATARRWVRSHGLWLDTRSKAERGGRLSRGGEAAPACEAGSVPLRHGVSVGEAWHAVLQDCLQQISVNASEIAAGSHDAEHVHQLRVGLRRLRSLQRFVGNAVAGEPAWRDAGATLFKRLGAARDRDALALAVLPQLQSAWAQWITPSDATALDRPTLIRRESEQPTVLVRGTEAQMFLLHLLEAVALPRSDSPAAGHSLRSRATQRLQRWHRWVQSDVKHFADLDDTQRHALRKRIKRLRYAADWVAPLFPRRAAKRYLAALRDAQACLGEINDVAVALEAFREPALASPQAMFALGWLAAQRDGLLAAAPSRLMAFAQAQRFWKKR
jgi:triphosphatase